MKRSGVTLIEALIGVCAIVILLTLVLGALTALGVIGNAKTSSAVTTTGSGVESTGSFNVDVVPVDLPFIRTTNAVAVGVQGAIVGWQKTHPTRRLVSCVVVTNAGDSSNPGALVISSYGQ